PCLLLQSSTILVAPFDAELSSAGVARPSWPRWPCRLSLFISTARIAAARKTDAVEGHRNTDIVAPRPAVYAAGALVCLERIPPRPSYLNGGRLCRCTISKPTRISS